MTDEPLSRELNAALTIQIKIDSACYINVTGNGEPVTITNTAFNRTKLLTLRRQTKKRFAQFSQQLRSGIAAGDTRLPAIQAIKALETLRSYGYMVLKDLLGQHHGKIPALMNLANRSIYGTDIQPEPILRWSPSDNKPKLIVFQTDAEDGIPIDIIPLLKPYSAPPAADPRDLLGRYACSFLGFSAIVKREMADFITPCRYLENAHGLPMKMFINRSLPGSRQEEARFKTTPHLHVEGGWPHRGDAPAQEDFPKLLASHLWEVNTRYGGPIHHHPDQICHFSCHSQTGGDRLPNDYEITLQSNRTRGRRTATIESLGNALTTLSELAQNDTNPRPLVFMNSC
jgi:hypothetical protein